MRAREFIAEHKKVGDLSVRNQQATVGLHKFRDAEFADRIYELNRIMMAVASNDGKEFVQDMDAESWVGRHDVAAPYTKVEQDMLKQAYKAVGSKHYDLNHGDLDSEEHPAVHTESPIKPFKGYN